MFELYQIKDYPSDSFARYSRRKAYARIGRKIKTIAVYKSSGALGDFIQSIPLFRNFKRMFPEAKIYYLGSFQKKHCETIFQNIPYADGFIEYYRPGGGWSFKQYRSFFKKHYRKFDLIVDTQGKFVPTFYLWLLNPKYFLSLNWFFSHWIFVLDSKIKVHVVAKMNFLARILGLEDVSFNPVIDIKQMYLSPAQDYLKRFQGPFIALIPGAGHPYKMWPKQMFAQLGDRCVEMGFSPILVGAHVEKELLLEVAALMRNKPIIPVADDPRFGQDPVYSIGLFKSSFLTIGNDCGGLHLATLSGCRVVGIYGPTSAEKSGPLGDNNIIFYRGLDCSPCKWFRQQCQIDRRCLRDISVDEVVSAVQHLARLGK